MTPRLRYEGGTLTLEPLPDLPGPWQDFLTWDDRSESPRALAMHYRTLLEGLRDFKVAVQDEAKGFGELKLTSSRKIVPYSHQTEALEAWKKAGRRGVVVLPTGAGKTLVAEMALEATPRSALIVVPTLDLLQQWYSSLLAAFPDAPIGLLGGGSKEFTPLTLATYDSTAIYAEQLGQSYGTLIFDECHHLPSDFTRAIAEFSIAPYRLGLTATPERGDGRHADLEELIGPTVYRRKPEELAGYALADYQEVRILVQLSESERSRYEVALATRNAFVRNNRRIQWGTLEGWELEATLKPKLDWNKELVEAYYTVCWDGGLKAPKRRDKDEGSEDIAPEDALLERFQKQATEWSVSREVDLLPLGGTVIVPDLKFTHPDGRVVFLEVLRFWEVSYLEKRLTALEREGRTDVLLAVSDRTQLEGKGRLSEAHSSRVLWFKGRLDVKGVLERLSALDKKEKALSRALD